MHLLSFDKREMIDEAKSNYPREQIRRFWTSLPYFWDSWLTHVSMQDESGGAPVNILRLEVCLARADNELLWGESCRCVYVWCALFV